MSLNFRDDLIKASEKQFEAQIDKHRINVEILLEYFKDSNFISAKIMIHYFPKKKYHVA